MSRFLDAVYRQAVLPFVSQLTRRDAEVAHEWMIATLSFLQRRQSLMRLVTRLRTPDDPRLRQTLMDDLEFPNPFGTAAGLDKNAVIYPALAAITGAGHIELGGITLSPQPGNERPRLVRVGRDNLINAMGFPNDGVDAFVKRLSTLTPPNIPLGMQVVKLKVTSDEDSAAEYGELVRRFAGVHNGRRLPDFFSINVSSPNTPGLRKLQDPKPLAEILDATTAALDEQTNLCRHPRHRLLIKLGPDLAFADVEAIIGLVEQFDVGGIVLTNTTITRPLHSKHDGRPGGFSGSALYGLSSKLVRFAAGQLPENRVLVATGGINTVDRAYEMLLYANLIGIYTGLVLQGPGLFRHLAKGVLERMEMDGVASLAELREGNRPKVIAPKETVT